MIYRYTILVAEGGHTRQDVPFPIQGRRRGNASSGMKHPSIGGHFRGEFVNKNKDDPLDNLGCRS